MKCVHDEISAQVVSRVYDQVDDQDLNRVRRQVVIECCRVRHQVEYEVWNQVENQVRNQVEKQVRIGHETGQ